MTKKLEVGQLLLCCEQGVFPVNHRVEPVHDDCAQDAMRLAIMVAAERIRYSQQLVGGRPRYGMKPSDGFAPVRVGHPPNVQGAVGLTPG